MRFTKMQGLGNDYVYIDCTKEAPDNLPDLARRMSRPHFGVGSDGLIGIFPSAVADFRMAMYNADGSQGEMCGNGIRCVGKYVYDKGLTDKTRLTIETLAGIKDLTLSVCGGAARAAQVDMGAPAVEERCTLTVAGREIPLTPVSMGNPHAVWVTTGVKGLDITAIGPAIEAHPRFPRGVNVEFAEVTGPGRLLMRVWERGSGETLACGTGACAAVAACRSMDLVGDRVTVSLRGGDLSVRWDWETGHLFMTGPAVTVFEGEWPDDI